jgi:cell division transport system permease protein
MAKSEDRHFQKQITGAYFTSVISITLVLFTLGLLGLIMLQANSLSNYIKENIGFEIIVKPGVKEADVLHLKKILDTRVYVKSTEYISTEEATRRLSAMLGDDFIDFLGGENNPLLPSIDLRFNAPWANSDSLAIIEAEVLQNKTVKEVYYQKSLVHLINKNLRKISLGLLGFSLLLLLIAMALVNNTIRLSIYSRRFIIRTMQLVGATEGFIRLPFVAKGISLGFVSAVIALAFLSGIIAVMQQQIPELALLINFKTLAFLYLFILVLGMLMSGFSTFFSVRKYLRISPDRLFG